jgi:hypothetical protein
MEKFKLKPYLEIRSPNRQMKPQEFKGVEEGLTASETTTKNLLDLSECGSRMRTSPV